MPGEDQELRLAVALDGAGWHPAAWREPDARPDELFTARYWVDLVTESERGLLDFVTIEDSLGQQRPGFPAVLARGDDPPYPPALARGDDPPYPPALVQGRLDAVLIAARVAPLTQHIGLVPTAIVTHTEPFHLSKAIATLDYVSGGRAGVRVRVDAAPEHAAHFGRRTIRAGDDQAARQLRADLFAEAADYVEVMRRLWDSWEDDAEIRDAASGRFVDRHKLHYIDFDGRWFSVRGPSITPRPPQGQPVVAALAHREVAYDLAGRSADVAFVTPRDAGHAASLVARIGAAQRAAGRLAEPVRVFADLLVYLDPTPATAVARRARLDDRAGEQYASDALAFTGTPGQLADLLLDWQAAGVTGFRLRPAAIPHDLHQVTRALVPELRRRGPFRREYQSASLRAHLGLARPASRYAA
jgi:alkanesulfonate monooxygenase SsuD/methylene tetrahydromethanopterin reductase-like flavin-dependent oxidoreductase (luciferase family)